MTLRRIMINHVDLLVRDLGDSRRFDEAYLAPLGVARMNQGETFSGFGADGAEDFALHLITEDHAPTARAHVAFVAVNRAESGRGTRRHWRLVATGNKRPHCAQRTVRPTMAPLSMTLTTTTLRRSVTYRNKG